MVILTSSAVSCTGQRGGGGGGEVTHRNTIGLVYKKAIMYMDEHHVARTMYNHTLNAFLCVKKYRKGIATNAQASCIPECLP